MHLTIHGIAVQACGDFTADEVFQLLSDLIPAWTWEGKIVEKVDLVRKGTQVHVYAYEEVSHQIIPYGAPINKE